MNRSVVEAIFSKTRVQGSVSIEPRDHEPCLEARPQRTRDDNLSIIL